MTKQEQELMNEAEVKMQIVLRKLDWDGIIKPTGFKFNGKQFLIYCEDKDYAYIINNGTVKEIEKEIIKVVNECKEKSWE